MTSPTTGRHHSDGPASTTEKLQSSARDFMKSLEDVMLLSGATSAATTHKSPHHHYMSTGGGGGGWATSITSGSTTTTSSGAAAASASAVETNAAFLRDGAATIEQAFRSIFSSCTLGAEEAIIPDDETLPSEQDHHHRQPLKQKKKHHQPLDDDDYPMDPSRPVTPSTAPFLVGRMNAAAVAATTTTTSAAIGRRSPVQMVMTSATAAAAASSQQQQQQHSPRDIGDHIYAQLLFDEQDRAMKAVDALRDQHHELLVGPGEQRPLVTTVTNNSPNNNNNNPTKDAIHRAFPRSTPAAVEASRLFLTAPRTMMTPSLTPLTPLSSDELNIPSTLTFDDGISAISAHTLEALAATATANQHHHHAVSGRVRSDLTRSSQESSIFPAATPSPPPLLEYQQDVEEELEELEVAGMMQGSPSRSSRSSSRASPLPTRREEGDLHQNHPHDTTTTTTTTTTLGAARSPFSVRHISPIPRVNSNHTWASGGKNSTSPTKDSRSTQTTRESSAGSFEVWRQEEKKYWADIMVNETTLTTASDSRSSLLGKMNGKRRRRRGNNDSRTHDQTLSTSSISALSTWSSHYDHRHPHDTVMMMRIEPIEVLAQRIDPAVMRSTTSSAMITPDFRGLARHVGDDFLLPEGTDMGEI